MIVDAGQAKRRPPFVRLIIDKQKYSENQCEHEFLMRSLKAKQKLSSSMNQGEKIRV
jgi:hypothetical protein